MTLRARAESIVGVQPPMASGGPGKAPLADARLLIEVADTGVGIPDSEIEKVFEAFEQTSSGRAMGGTGLGLPLSRKLAQMMGGDMDIQSEPGKGTTLRFEVLIGEAEADSIEANATERRVVGLQLDQLPKRILVADDIHTNRKLLTGLLGGVGFEITEASDGREAIDLFGLVRPDLVLMDRAMPRVDGLEAMKCIKAMEGGAQTPVISISASAFEDQRQEMLDEGAADFIRKPFRERELFDTIAKHIDVRYDYQAVGSEVSEGIHSHTTLSPSAISDNIPSDLLAQMKSAAENGYMNRLVDLIEEVKSIDGDMAIELRELADRYDYETLSRLLGGGDSP